MPKLYSARKVLKALQKAGFVVISHPHTNLLQLVVYVHAAEERCCGAGTILEELYAGAT